MSDFLTLKEVILGAVSRASSSFQAGSVNFVDYAINNAVLYAQRQHDFEWCKGTVSVDCAPKGSILVAKDENGCACKVKRIIKAFGTHVPTGHQDQAIPYVSRTSQISDETNGVKNHATVCGPKVVQHGVSLYLSPYPSAEPNPEYTLWFEAVKLLPRLTKPTDTNFLFDYGFDFLQYRSIIELNSWIKEDERYGVSKALVENAWNSLLSWDGYLVSITDSEDL